ncbi:MAG: flippase [Candidatus Omnitrophota bacterium]
MPHKIIIKNFSSLIIAQVLYKVITFLMMIAIARYLGVDRFGQLSYALSFVWVFMFLSDFGLSELFIRDVAQDVKLKEKYINNIITLKIFLGVFIFGAIYFFATIFSLGRNAVSAAIIILGASVIFDSFMYFFRSIFRVEETMEYEGILLLIEGVLKLAVIVIAIRFGLNIPGVILISLAMLAVSLINFTVNLVIFTRKNPNLAFSFDLWFWLSILKSAAPFMSISILTFLNFRINIIALSLIKGDYSAGLYNANYRLLEQILLLPIAFSAASLPAFSRLSASLGSLNSFLRKVFFLALFVSISLIISCYLFGAQIINLIYGESFQDAGIYLGMLSWVLLPFFVKAVIEKLLFGLRKQGALLFIYLSGSGLNILLNIILIPSIGINGASFGTFICELLIVLTCILLFRKSLTGSISSAEIMNVKKDNIINESAY